MERNRGSKIIAIVALCFAIAGLSLGFASFSSTLNISSSLEVNQDPNTFKVVFSSSGTNLETNKIQGNVSSENVTATEAEIDNSGNSAKITKLSATFKEPGDKVEYTFYAHNSGKYLAYLNSITYQNATDETSPKVCKAKTYTDEEKEQGKTDTTDAYVQAACDDITLTIKVEGTGSVGTVTTTGSKDSISDHTLGVDDFEKIVVTIEYSSTGDRADGDFSVKFGDISLKYDSVD